MNKKLMCGLILSVSLFSISAYAADGDDALTTKKYVNDGLSFVYKVANGTENGAVKTLQQQVGDSTAGLIKDVADVQNALSDGNNGLVNVGDLANAVGAKGTGGATGTGLAGEVQSLQKTVGDGNTGLSKDVADLQQTVSTLQSNSKTYNAGAGIEVTEGAGNNPSTIGIALPNGAADGAKYVFQSNGAGGGTWTQMEVASEWSTSDFLNGIN
jgi:hypothetical protein